MDRLNNVHITYNGGTVYDFAHISRDFFFKKIVDARDRLVNAAGNIIVDVNTTYFNSNLQVVENALEINKLIYKLSQAKKASGDAPILSEKLLRAIAFKDIVNNFVLETVMIMYYQNFPKLEKGALGLNRAFQFAIKIGKQMMSTFEKELDEEYNIAEILEEEFSKKGLNRASK